MLKKEWQSLWKNKFLVVVLIAIITIPTIYTSIFLGSMWDPYGEVDHLPVAVVNNDKAVDFEGKTMNVGEELVNNLKENNQLDFNFVDATQAEDGLKNGTYYMVITIPENFSENATTLLDENPTKMELKYDTNPGTNYIASKMSETAINKIRTNVAEKITKQYSETIFDKISEIGDGFDDATDATGKLVDATDKLKDGSGTLNDKLTTLADSTLTFSDGEKQLSVAVGTYTDSVQKLSDGSVVLKDGLDTLAGKTGTLSEGAPLLSDGASKLNSAVDTYTGVVGQINDGTKKITAKNKALNDAVQTLADGTGQLSSASKSLLGGLNTLASTLDKSLTKENIAQIATLQSGITQVNAAMKELNTAVQGIDVSGVSGLTNTVTGGLTQIGSHTKDAGTDLEGVKTDIGTAIKKVTTSSGFAKMTEEEQNEVLSYLSAIYAEDSNLVKAGNDVKAIGATTQALGQGLASADLSQLKSIDTLKTKVNQLTASADTVLKGSSKVISSQQAGLVGVQTALERTGKTQDKMGVIQVMSTLSAGLESMNSKVTGKDGLQDSIKTYTGKVGEVNSAVTQLNSKSSALTSATTTLSSKLTSLADSVPQLAAGVTKLQSGATTLHSSLGKLASNNDKLNSNIGKLTEASTKINDGSTKLADASKTLNEKLGTLNEACGKLDKSINDASEEVKKNNATDKTNSMLANPVETVNREESSVDNNGNAMAAYMMGVGLWVACIAFCIMYPLSKPAGKIKNSFSWWISKASVVGTIAIAQGAFMIYMLKWILGFNPAHFGKTLLIAVLASLAFMSIMYFFNLLMGKVGSFILLIFMVLQLGGSAGTYPLELSGGFYKAIHPFMPFTYSVNAFRATIATGQSIAPAIGVFTGMIVVFTTATIVLFHFKAKKAMVEENIIEGNVVLE